MDKKVQYQKAILVYKCLNGIAPHYLQEMLKRIQSDFGLRSAEEGNLLVPKPNIEQFKKSFQFSGVATWNSLPPDVKESMNINIFKTKCFNYLFNDI